MSAQSSCIARREAAKGGGNGAYIFSFKPPTGNTCPKREISPVIATSGSTLVFVNSETNAVRMAVPAEGPSLPMAPSGLRRQHPRSSRSNRRLSRVWRGREDRGPTHMWRCRSRSCNIVSASDFVTPNRKALDLTHDRAICADSRMTSPSLPVNCRLPLPGIDCASALLPSSPSLLNFQYPVDWPTGREHLR